MPKPMIRIHNVENNTVIDRDMTTEEIAMIETAAASLRVLEEATANKVAAKTALLERLGITEDEAKLLLS